MIWSHSVFPDYVSQYRGQSLHQGKYCTKPVHTSNQILYVNDRICDLAAKMAEDTEHLVTLNSQKNFTIGGSVGQESACSAGDQGLIPGLGRSPGEGNGSPLQYSSLQNPMDRGAWWATVHGVIRVRQDLATKPPPPSKEKLERICGTGTGPVG